MSVQPIQQAEEEYSDQQRVEYSLKEFLKHARENPNAVSDSVRYVVNAIEYFGTRKTIEQGEEKERYRFFDDPKNNGEHAIYGNTEQLNSFVDSLKRKCGNEGENNKIVWFAGPTATGKSELKRCLLNGVQAYAQTEEGRRYTLEWSIDSLSTATGMTYGTEAFSGDNRDWYKSPVNVNPLLVLPEKIREMFVEELEEIAGYPIEVEGELDPFSRVAYEYLSEEYNSFEKIVSENHLRVVSYVPDVGEGFGILQSEDVGNPKQKMVGSWMQDAMEKYALRGKKNAQAFTYDGVISQGNSLISLIEDAHNHNEMFPKLMNVCEDNIVKLDNKIAMHVDTLIICISNPDFEAALMQYQESQDSDPYKALRRRLEKYEFRYLTSVILETQLLLKHLLNENVVWDEEDPEELMEYVSQPIEKYGTHFSPHAVEAASYYNVATRIVDSSISRFDKIAYYDKGYVIDKDGKKKTFEEEEIFAEADGKNGIPITYTEKILSELAQNSDGVVMPFDVIEAISDGMDIEPVFSDSEVTDFRMQKSTVKTYINQEMESDVLDAMVGDNDISKEEVTSYVDSLFSWEEEDKNGYDPYELREFEKRYFNVESDEYGEEASPSGIVKSFRKTRIIQPINKYIYDNKNRYDPEDIPIEESHTIKTLLEDESWRRVERLYPNLDFSMWRNPSSGSETEEVKERTIENMMEKGYNEESAERACDRIISLRN